MMTVGNIPWSVEKERAERVLWGAGGSPEVLTRVWFVGFTGQLSSSSPLTELLRHQWQVWKQSNILDFTISSRAGQVLYSIVPVGMIAQQTLTFSSCYAGLCVTPNIHFQGNIPKSSWSTWPTCFASIMLAGNESLLSNVFIAWSLLDELIWFLNCLNEVSFYALTRQLSSWVSKREKFEFRIFIAQRGCGLWYYLV